MSLLSKDFDDVAVCATQFVVSGKSLSFVSTDEALNVRLHQYTRSDPASWSGTRLMPL